MELHQVVEMVSGVTKRTGTKLRHQCNRWSRFGLPAEAQQITAEHFEQFRREAQRQGLSPATINATVRDVASLVRRQGRAIDPGRQLRERPRCRPVPMLDQIESAYHRAAAARWPNCDQSRTPALMRVSNEQFWRAFLLVAYYTGMRLSDLMALEWSAITADSIQIVAQKTGKPHAWPMHTVIERHLRPLRVMGSERVFAFPTWAQERIRRELVRIGGVGLTPQALRRAAVTTWTELSDTCRLIVQGSGLGVTVHYVDQLRVLRRVADRFPWPESALPADQRNERTRQIESIRQRLDRVPLESLASVCRVVDAFVG